MSAPSAPSAPSGPSAPSSARHRSRWPARVVAASVVWVLLAVGARVLGGEPRLGLLALTVAATGTTLWACLDAARPGAGTVWDREVDEPVRPPGEDTRLAALTRMVAAHVEARQTDDALQRQLVALADQRLMAGHGVSWRVDPERAAPLLGPELVALARQTRPYPRMTLQQVDVLLSRIEAL